MGRTGTRRLVVKKEGFELELERQEDGKFHESLNETGNEAVLRREGALYRASLGETALGAAVGSPAVVQEVAGVYVTSPMVGTFYASPSPDDPHFVKVGDKIDKQTVVCIIEAMKVMNEVKAGVSGTVAEILVENGHPVEFGTKLFRVI